MLATCRVLGNKNLPISAMLIELYESMVVHWHTDTIIRVNNYSWNHTDYFSKDHMQSVSLFCKCLKFQTNVHKSAMWQGPIRGIWVTPCDVVYSKHHSPKFYQPLALLPLICLSNPLITDNFSASLTSSALPYAAIHQKQLLSNPLLGVLD